MVYYLLIIIINGVLFFINHIIYLHLYYIVNIYIINNGNKYLVVALNPYNVGNINISISTKSMAGLTVILLLFLLYYLY